ncbi:LCP family protein [Solibacillus sp. FSL W8-0474]|uniref:LCP family glycopolymer transferase n=1 Tax=Solibacillus sp. FSL W8-0474 TaxID=2975336 RepID=UPI0030FC90CC
MKKVWKWLGSIALVLCSVSLIMFMKVYGDIKSTAEEIYTPIGERLSEVRAQPVDIKTKKEPISALILGVDERDGDGGRSDTMIVLTVNPTLETTKMLSIPRDTYTEMIGKGFKDKINHAYSFGGMEMSMKSVENLLNIPIDYVVKVNMESFVDIIDIVGGITVENTLAFNYDGESFPAGQLKMDGEKSLKYVRMRYDDPSGDFGRQNRQKQVIQGVLQESMSLNTVWNYKSIFEAVEKNVELNIVFEDVLKIRKNYGDSFKQIEQLYMNNGTSMMKNNIYYYLPDEWELQEIQGNLREHLEI